MTFPRSPTPSSDRPAWHQRGRRALTERIGLKVTSLIIAVLLWLVVGARQPTEAYVRVRLDPQLDSALVLLDSAPHLRALVAGRAADIVKLSTTPPVVHRSIGGDAPDTLVLDVAPGDVRIPADLAEQIRVVDVVPRSVTLRFGTRASRRVAVVNDGRVQLRGDSSAQRATRIVFDPDTVHISGPRRTVRQFSAIHPAALTLAVGDTLPHVADLDTVGLGVRVTPAQVRVRLHPGGSTALTRAP